MARLLYRRERHAVRVLSGLETIPSEAVEGKGSTERVETRR